MMGVLYQIGCDENALISMRNHQINVRLFCSQYLQPQNDFESVSMIFKICKYKLTLTKEDAVNILLDKINFNCKPIIKTVCCDLLPMSNHFKYYYVRHSSIFKKSVFAQHYITTLSMVVFIASIYGNKGQRIYKIIWGNNKN